jgi:hypothetical protein
MNDDKSLTLETDEELLKFEDILLEALAFAQDVGQTYWSGFILTMLTAMQENLEEEFAVICESFLHKMAEDKKEKEQILPFHFIVNHVGNS